MITLDDVRRFAVSRSLFTPTTLEHAIDTLGFVQADPIRAPARAQDLTLRPRVDAYRAGDLERFYPALPVEEDVFINYGYVTRSLQSLMHPRSVASLRPTARNQRAQAVLSFVRERGTVHPRDVDAHFSHGRVTQHGPAPVDSAARAARIDAIVDLVVRKYAPLPAARLSYIVGRLRYAVPQWRDDLRSALQRAKHRLSHTRIEGIDWYWPASERMTADAPSDIVRLLAPFDPVVWDRERFEILWGWAYRFEAYTPAPKRRLGYYALPLLWRDRIVGWGNLSVAGKELQTVFGYVGARPPRDRAFKRELEAEVERMRTFLNWP